MGSGAEKERGSGRSARTTTPVARHPGAEPQMLGESINQSGTATAMRPASPALVALALLLSAFAGCLAPEESLESREPLDSDGDG